MAMIELVVICTIAATVAQPMIVAVVVLIALAVMLATIVKMMNNIFGKLKINTYLCFTLKN